MKLTFFLSLNLMFLAVSNLFSQSNPVADTEMRDSTSLRMRAIQLERVKRDANKSYPNETNEETNIRFAKIKEDFENIQKIEAEIIKAYTTGKQINYSKISDSAAELHKKAVRLEANLFNIKEITDKKDEKKKQLSVRDLIIELDKALGNFLNSPIFKSNKLIEEKDVEKSQMQLEKVIKLSETLSQEAKKSIQ